MKLIYVFHVWFNMSFDNFTHVYSTFGLLRHSVILPSFPLTPPPPAPLPGSLSRVYVALYYDLLSLTKTVAKRLELGIGTYWAHQ